MGTMGRMIVASAGVFAFAAPAAAQTFEAEIDCGDVWQQGEQVPFTVRFEEQAFQNHTIDVLVTISGPGGIGKTLVNTTINLGPNQDLDRTKFINLPANAPVGDYDMRVTADDGTTIQSDSCSFDVI